MAKVRLPFLSFGSQGTIGSALTSQRRARDYLFRKKPIPANPRSLPQMYQRWLYQDYAHLWLSQHPDTKRTYAAAGSHYHLTGFQYWMKCRLNQLDDIAAWWRFDNFVAGTTPDSGPNDISATLFGCTPAQGRIARALHFDGINDWLNCTAHEALDLTTALSVELLFYSTIDAAEHPVWSGILVKWECYAIVLFNGVIYAGVQRPGDAMTWLNSGVPVEADSWYHALLTYDNALARLYLDGELKDTDTYAGPLSSIPTNALLVGTWAWAPGQYVLGRVDNLLVYNRVLDAIDAKRHSERRYPPQ